MARRRRNVDGEPYQGSIAQYMVEQVRALQPRRLTFCHHDAILPGDPDVDPAPVIAALAEQCPGVTPFTMTYATPVEF